MRVHLEAMLRELIATGKPQSATADKLAPQRPVASGQLQ